MTDRDMTRRQWMQSVAAATAATVFPTSRALAPENPPTVTAILSSADFTDQYGKRFDPQTTLKDKPYLLVFGFEGCARCENIGASLAATQKALLEAGYEVPIVVVSVNPEEDRLKMKEYVARYYEQGIKQIKDEKFSGNAETRYALGKEAFDKFQNEDKKKRTLLANKEIDQETYNDFLRRAQRGRLLHILCAPSQKKAVELEDQLAITGPDPKGHTGIIFLCDKDGKKIYGHFGVIPTSNEKERAKLVEAMKEKMNQISKGG